MPAQPLSGAMVSGDGEDGDCGDGDWEDGDDGGSSAAQGSGTCISTITWDHIQGGG